MGDVSREQLYKVRWMVSMANYPPKFERAWLDDFDDQTRIVCSRMMVENKSLYLHGEVGVGKSHLACACGSFWLIHQLNTRKISISTKVVPWFYEAANLFLDHRTSIQSNNEHRFVERLCQKPLLIIDDIGTEKLTEAKIELLYIIINKRYGYGLPVIMTANMDLNMFAEMYHDRLASRISEMGIQYQVKGTDRRMKQNQLNKDMVQKGNKK